MSFGVTPEGFKAKRLIDIKNDLEDAFVAEFGDINLDAQSVTGQIIGIFSKTMADIWENLENVYESQYVSSASGVALDNVAYLLGITRLPAQRTIIDAVAYGTTGTFIQAGSLARIPTTNQVFYSASDVIISNSNAVQNVVDVTLLAAQQYTVILESQSYIYSLPNINFSGPFVAGNSINVKVNGIFTGNVNFTTNNATTLGLIATAILTSPDILSATVVGNTIEIVANTGKQAIINTVSLSGAGVPSYSITFQAPLLFSSVATNLAAIINTDPKYTSSDNGNSTFTITAFDTSTGYSILTGTNLAILSTGSPIRFLAQSFGPIPAPANSLNEIVTPVPGWNSVNNIQAGSTGRNEETDSELRIRRALSLRLGGAATVESIRARLLQQVQGVTSVLIFENVTMTQAPILVTFNADFVTGNNIDVIVDEVSIATVPYVTSHLITIQNVAALLATDSQILSATVGGVTNREITVLAEEGTEFILDFAITGGASQTTFSINGGRPPKSFETVVQGGTDQDVGDLLWIVKPAGIQTFGNTQVNVLDSMGNTQAVFFSRAVPIYIWVLATITLNPQETFPSNGLQQVSNAILAYGNSLGIGVDVFIQRVEAAVFSVPGIASVSVQLARTTNPTDTPIYGNVDIPIADVEISAWDLSRINVGL